MSDNKWPNLFVVGAAKAGTTSLYNYLNQHPDIYMSPFKEPKFFADINPSPHLKFFVKYISNETEYLNLFKKSKNQKYLGEASTVYLWDSESPKRIYERCPEAKVLIILRDPIDRAFSHYLNDIREGIESRSFRESLDDDLKSVEKGWCMTPLYIDLGLYSQQVERYLNLFQDNVYVLFFEEFFDNPVENMDKIFKFLDVSSDISKSLNIKTMNAYAKPRFPFISFLMGHSIFRSLSRKIIPKDLRSTLRNSLFVGEKKPKIDSESFSLLYDIYKPEKTNLKKVLNRDIPW